VTAPTGAAAVESVWDKELGAWRNYIDGEPVCGLYGRPFAYGTLDQARDAAQELTAQRAPAS
jgi:hypothetical protein